MEYLFLQARLNFTDDQRQYLRQSYSAYVTDLNRILSERRRLQQLLQVVHAALGHYLKCIVIAIMTGPKQACSSQPLTQRLLNSHSLANVQGCGPLTTIIGVTMRPDKAVGFLH